MSVTKRALPALLLAVSLGGCISFGPKVPDQLLRLTPAEIVPAGTTMTVQPGQAITILWPTVPAELATNRVPVRTAGTAVAYVKDAQWVEPPNRLFQRLLADVVTARTGRPVLSPRQFAADPGVRITGSLDNFGIDAAGMAAVVTYDAVVARGDMLQTRRFEARVPVSAIDATTVGVALNQAANQVAAQVADWVK